MTDLHRRYGLTAAHSEVVCASELIQPCATLDMGCSNGRNALFLSQLGFQVTAVDNNPRSARCKVLSSRKASAICRRASTILIRRL